MSHGKKKNLHCVNLTPLDLFRLKSRKAKVDLNWIQGHDNLSASLMLSSHLGSTTVTPYIMGRIGHLSIVCKWFKMLQLGCLGGNGVTTWPQDSALCTGFQLFLGSRFNDLFLKHFMAQHLSIWSSSCTIILRSEHWDQHLELKI